METDTYLDGSTASAFILRRFVEIVAVSAALTMCLTAIAQGKSERVQVGLGVVLSQNIAPDMYVVWCGVSIIGLVILTTFGIDINQDSRMVRWMTTMPARNALNIAAVSIGIFAGAGTIAMVVWRQFGEGVYYLMTSGLVLLMSFVFVKIHHFVAHLPPAPAAKLLLGRIIIVFGACGTVLTVLFCQPRPFT